MFGLFGKSKMEDSWESVREKIDELFNSSVESDDSGKMVQAQKMASQYFSKHPECLEAGYKVAYCHYAAMVCDWSFADAETAKTILKKIHSQGYSDAAFVLGKIYLREENEIDGFFWIKRSVEEKPEDKSILELAKMYSEGKGVTADNTIAEDLFRKLIPSQHNNPDFLGAYADHLFRFENPECIEWYKKQLENPADLWDEAAALHSLVLACLKFDKITEAKKYCREGSELIRQCEDDETLEFVKESYFLSFNEINIYEAKKG